jgi:signal transduction histidine kinase
MADFESPRETTVFVADDNPSNLEVLINFLSQSNLTVVPLRSGEELLKLVQRRLPDIILLDIVMPGGIDGFETCRRLKSDPATQDIPVIFMSALTEAAEKVMGFRLGAVDYVSKPIEEQELLARVSAHLTISRLQKQLIKANASLEEKVLDRTRALSEANQALKLEMNERKQMEARLRQTQKLESLGTLAGGVAHDFNNILGAIIGYVELAQDSVAEDSSASRDLAKALGACNRAKELIDQILAFSRQKETELRPIQLRSIVKEAMQLMRSSFSSTIAFRRLISKDVGTVQADSTQIHQVVINLCTNAAHAMREAGGVLEVELANAEIDELAAADHAGIVPGRYVRLTVRDSGPGIEPEILDRIFDPYFTTKGQGEGTGLGLAVVHGVVKTHGGAVVVENSPGEGAAFHVYLPRTEQHAERAGAMEQIHLPTGAETVLLVDDERDLLDIGRRVLADLGYQVVAASNGLEALELFRMAPDQFDLVITDQTMPHMAGLTLAAELLRIRPELPIVLCSGFMGSEAEGAIRGVGVKEFVKKPLSKGKLAKAVRRVLDSR